MNRNYKRKPTSRELNKVVNSFTVYKFVKALTTDFTDMPAFRSGVIDNRGNFIMNPRGKISVFDTLIINLKVLLNMIPNPSIKAKLNYLTTGISLLAENYDENPEEVKKEIDQFLNETFLLTEEKPTIQTTGHMTHVGDWSYTPKKLNTEVDPHLGLKHIEAMNNWFHGKETAGHSVDIKADGGVSFLFGKNHNGEMVGGYKTGKLFTTKQLETHEAPWAKDVKNLLHHFEGMKIKHGHVFQGDLLWAGRHQLTQQGTAQPNTIHYKPTKHSVGIAVHGHYKLSDSGDLLKQKEVDHSQLHHADVYAPNLTLKSGSMRLTPGRAKDISNAIKSAKEEMTPEVENYTKTIHKNKKFAKFFQEYSNEVVATSGKRNISSMLKYIHTPISKAQTSKAYMQKSSQSKLSEKTKSSLASELQSHIEQNKNVLSKLLKHQQHLTTAKHHMLDQLKEYHGGHTLVPHGNEEHEGLVSNFHGESLAKLTREGPSGFSSRNRANSLKRFGPVHEDGAAMSAGAMTASSGAVTGVTPGKPEETIVHKYHNIKRRKRIKALKEVWVKLQESSVPPVGKGQPVGDNPRRSTDKRKPSSKPPETKSEVKQPKDEFIPSKSLGFKPYSK